MQRLEVSGAVRPIYGSLGVKRLINQKVVRCLDGAVMHVCSRQNAAATSLDEVYLN